jgi:hypothetical protein
MMRCVRPWRTSRPKIYGGDEEMGDEAETTLEQYVAYPEAPASASVRCQVEGFEWLITIRGFETDGTAGRKLIEKIKVVNEAIVKMGGGPIFGRGNGGKPTESTPATEGEPAEKLCPVHNVMMARRTGTSGTWYSHSLGKGLDGKTIYCNGSASKN